MYIILVSLVNGSMLKEYHASALYKWAKLLAKGEPAVSLAAVPTVVAKRKAIELWSDDDESPSYRPKNEECVKPIPIPSDIIGAPSPSANKLLVWSKRSERLQPRDLSALRGLLSYGDTQLW